MRRILGLIVATICLAGSVRADDPEPASATSPETPAQPSATGEPAKPSPAGVSGSDVAASPEKKPAGGIIERLIYLPFKNFRAVFGSPGAAAFVPLDELLRLYEAQRKPADPPPPVNGVITQADYVAAVDGDTATITATLRIRALAKEWAEVPLKFGEAAIGDWSCEQKGVLLRGVGPGAYALLFPKDGEYEVKFTLLSRVLASPDGRSLELDVPAVGASTFDLTIPEAGQSVAIRPSLVGRPVEPKANKTRVRSSLGATEKISASWSPRVGSKPDMELLTSVTSATAVHAGDGLVHVDAFFSADVLRGQLERFQFAAPLGWRILDVSGETRIREWTSAQDETRQIITIELLGKATQKAKFEVHAEFPLADQGFHVAGTEEAWRGVHALGALRESGQVAVSASNDLSLAIDEQRGVSRIDESEVEPRLKKAGAVYFKFYSSQFRLHGQVKPVEPRITVQHKATVAIAEDQVRSTTELNYQVERAGLFEVVVKLPAGLKIERVTGSAPIRQHDVSADGALLTVAFREKQLGAFQLVVVGAMEAAATGQTAIPLLEPVKFDVEDGVIRVQAAEAFEVATRPELIVGLQPKPGAEVALEQGMRLIGAWEFHRRPASLAAVVTRKPSRLSASVGTRIDLKQMQTQLQSTVRFVVEYAGLDTFRIATPAAVGDLAQITLAPGQSTPAIQQKSRLAEPVDGSIVWTVILQRPHLGSVAFLVTYDVPVERGDGEAASASGGLERRTLASLPKALPPRDSESAVPAPNAPTANVPVPNPPAEPAAPAAVPAAAGRSDAALFIPLSHLQGEASIHKDKSLAVAVEPAADNADLEAIDVRELTLLPQDGFAAFRYFVQPASLRIVAGKFEIQPVVETVVSTGHVRTVLDRTGTATIRATYQVKSSERQRLRIDLPANTEPLGVLVDGKLASLEKSPATDAKRGWDPYFVNVARTKSSDEPFSLLLQYRLPLSPAPFDSSGGRLGLRLPQVGGSAGASVAVQRQTATVWTPREFALVGSPVGFDVELSRRVFDWLSGDAPPARSISLDDGGGSAGVFEFPVEGVPFQYSALGPQDTLLVRWWNRSFLAWTASGIWLIAAVILRRTSWENKLTVLLLSAVIAALIAVVDRDLAVHLTAASVWGVAGAFAIWLLAELLGPRSEAASPPSGMPPSDPGSPSLSSAPSGPFDAAAPANS